MNKLESEFLGRAFNIAVKATTVVTVTSGMALDAINNVTSAEAQTFTPSATPLPTPDCNVPVIINNQYKKDGQLVGPAVNVDFFIRAKNDSGLPIRITTNSQGRGSGTFEGKADTEFQGKRAINLERVNLNSISSFPGICGEPVERNIITDAGNREITPGTVVTPRGTPVTLTPVNMENIQKAAEQIATAEAIRESNRVKTATVEAVKTATQRALATEFEGAKTQTPIPAQPRPEQPQPEQPKQPEQPVAKEGEPGIFYVPVAGGVARFFGDIVFNNIGTAGRWTTDRTGDFFGGVIRCVA